jgi:hypothetical protein
VGCREEVGLGTLGDGVLWVDWAQWEKPVQNSRRPPCATHQSRHKREQLPDSASKCATASFFLPSRASETIDRQAGAAWVAMFSKSATIDRAGVDVSVGVGGLGIEGSGSKRPASSSCSASSECEAERSFLHTPTGE